MLSKTGIRFLDLSVDADARRKYLLAIESILTSGQILNGPEVDAFERQVSTYCHTNYAVGVGSGTAALYLALKCLRIGPGDEVIMPALSFVGTANAVAAVGARPVFVDIRDDLLINPGAAEAAITRKTKAIMPVQFTGNVCEMNALTQISERNSISLVEDAAPAFGATYSGRKAGSFGILGCFSMNPMKVLGAVGEAGAVVTPFEELWSRLRDLRYHGIRNKDICLDISLNARLDTLQAAVLCIRLQDHERNLERRQAIAERYSTWLSKVVEVPKVAANVRHAWYHYTIICERRDELAVALQKLGIETRVYHARLMPEHPAHAGDVQACPVGRMLVDRILCLPMHDKLRDDEVDYVAEAIVNFYGNQS